MPKLTTSYLENLPSPNYKKREFLRTIEEEIPAETFKDKDKFLAVADKHQKMCEALVKGDINRHVEEMKTQD